MIKSTDGSALDFINSYSDSSVKKFIHVDELDGIFLYDSFAHAVNGGTTNATALAVPSNSIPIEVTVENSVSRVLAQVNGFELNTERETVDTTALSEEFRSRINTLISGSGRMSCVLGVHRRYNKRTAQLFGRTVSSHQSWQSVSRQVFTSSVMTTTQAV